MLPLLKQRVEELNKLAGEVWALAEQVSKGDKSEAQSKLSVDGQKWFRGARELMVQNAFSGLDEFDDCYRYHPQRGIPGRQHARSRGDLEAYFSSGDGENFPTFSRLFRKARALVCALEDELLSRELPVKSQLSFAVSASEFDTAANILADSKGEETLLRASGVIARVALERHLYTVLEGRKIAVVKNPPSKKHPDAEDVTQTLQKNGILTPVQKSQLDSLFKVANNCAHPKETVNHGDVERLIRDGKQLASAIL